MRHQNGHHGSKISLDDIVPDYESLTGPDGKLSQASFQTAQRVLSVRREVMDRLGAIREVGAKLLRHEAESQECSERMSEELNEHRKKEIGGRMLQATARAEYCREKIKHYELELDLFYRSLGG